MNSFKLSNIMIFCIISTIYCTPSYISHINVSDSNSGDADLGTYVMKFVIDKSNLKYGQIFGVPVYNVALKNCKVHLKEAQFPDWYAALVNVPGNCGSRSITKELESKGADFIFLNHEASDAKFIPLLPHDIDIPVYEISNY